MNFARKQLEKYGWTDGKGLGKNENGISEALKPKLKRSVAGVGHDPASEFNEHWWSALYDKAASNVEVEERNGKTKKIKTKDAQDFVITNSTWKINNKSKKSDDKQYSDYFVRTAILASGGSKTENVKESDSEEEKETADVFKLTDEELFAACEGRTAHKGARHGLKALGKLARIAKQEEMLLSQPQYAGYSHSKNNKKSKIFKVIEDTNLNNDDNIERKKKKKKRNHCFSRENHLNNIDGYLAELPNEHLPEKDKIKTIAEGDSDTNEINNGDIGSKLKLPSKKDLKCIKNKQSEDSCEIVMKSKKKKKRKVESIEVTEQLIHPVEHAHVKKKKKL